MIIPTEYMLYRARVEGTRSTSNRFLCRILPHMADFPDINLLPDYPNFFREEQPAYKRGDVVWVICDNDYQIGYILGIAETSVGSGYNVWLRRINDAEKEAGLLLSAPESLTYRQEFEVAIDFFNRDNNQCGRILTNGTVVLYGADGSIYVRNPQSSYLLSKDGSITINAKDVNETVKDVEKKAANISETCSKLTQTIGGNAVISTGGSLQLTSGANRIESVGGTQDTTIIGKKRETIGGGVRTRVVTGGSSTVALLGDIDQKAVAGSVNTEGVTVKIVGGMVTIEGGVLDLNVQSITARGPGITGTLGPFCSIPICPVLLVPHAMPTYLSVDPSPTIQMGIDLLTLPPV